MAAISVKVSKMRSTMMGASPREASSTTTILGSEANARTKDSICCSPPLRLPAICFKRVASAGKDVTAFSMVADALPLGDWRMRLSFTVSEGKIPRPSGRLHMPRRDMS